MEAHDWDERITAVSDISTRFEREGVRLLRCADLLAGRKHSDDLLGLLFHPNLHGVRIHPHDEIRFHLEIVALDSEGE